MSYRCTNCNYLSFNSINDDIHLLTDEIVCKKCNKSWTIKKIDCLYCETKDKWESNHFLCEICWVWMCDTCYDEMKEHDYHYHRICENVEDILYEKIVSKIWYEPDYICEKCLDNIENKKTK